MQTQVNPVMSSVRSNLAQTAIVSMAELVALSLLGLVLAYWTWAWFAPSPLPQARAVATPASRLAAAGDLFGALQGGQTADTPTGLAIRLLGVMAAEPEGTGYALLQLDAKKTQVVRAGAELAPGIRLEKVLAHQVILLRNGTRETLAWPKPGEPATHPTSTPIR
jgi:general secretion pathway protein C